MSDLRNPDSKESAPLLRRQDQCVIAAVTFVALLAMAGYWIVQGGLTGQLIEVRDAQRLTATFEIDINRAAWPEFTLLPDIGETLARRIVESREKEGRFRRHDDLRRVRGIGPKTLEKLRPYLAPIGGEGAEGMDGTDGTDRTDGIGVD